MSAGLCDTIFGSPLRDTDAQHPDARRCLLGLVPGEGIGPVLTEVAREVLDAVQARSPHRFEVELGGAIGVEAVREHGTALSGAAVGFFGRVLGKGGAVLCGPGGHRFVYDLRKQFDLFFKLSPIVVAEELLAVSRLRPELVRGLDLVVVRDNVGGIYQGQWRSGHDAAGRRFAEHTFASTEHEVGRLCEVAARLCAQRSGRLSVVLKHGGVPTITTLWHDVARQVAESHGLTPRFVDADLAAYLLMHDPRAFDVILCPNMIGDIIGDLLAVALGSRGLSYSGNFTAERAGVYQTNHGSAFDLVGTDRANPVGHLHALAMLLAESFGLVDEAGWIRGAIKEVWQAGIRTFDVAGPADQIVGTREFGARVADHIAPVARAAQ